MGNICDALGPTSGLCYAVAGVTGIATNAAGTAIASATGSVLGQISAAMASAATGLLKTLATFWMNVDVPDLSAASQTQTDIRWITTVVAVVSILVAAGQMTLRRRGEPAAAMLTGLARLVFTSAAAVFVVGTAASVSDHYTADMMNSTTAHLGSGGWSGAISTTLIAGSLAPGDAMTLIIALLIIIASLIQLMLMVLRVGLVIILTGTLPLAAAASMTGWGESWWRKHLGWLAAWLLYKPAAAILYVSAFQLTQGKSLVETMSGFMILILSVLILPALLKVIVPATSHLGAATGGAIAVAAGGALASGAIKAGLHLPGGLTAALKSRIGSAQGGKKGPSGAEVTAPGDRRSGSESSSSERRSPSPSGSESSSRDGVSGSDGQRGPGGSRGGDGQKGPGSDPTGGPAAVGQADPSSGRPPGGAKRGPVASGGTAPTGAGDPGAGDAPGENGS
jgi:hypothetical protein